MVKDESLDYPAPEEFVVRIDRVTAQPHVILEEDARDFRPSLEDVVQEDGGASAIASKPRLREPRIAPGQP